MPTRDKDDKTAIEPAEVADVTENQSVSEHRRKIIKASAAVIPVIMTIRSGAAAAMTSINQCEARDAANAALLPKSEYAVRNPDEWVRMQARQVTIGKVKRNGNSKEQVLFGLPDNGVVAGSVNASYKEWYDKDGRTVDKKSITYTVTDAEFAAGKDVYLLCYVDARSGTYTWYPQRPVAILDQSVSAITASCLTSVNPDFMMG